MKEYTLTTANATFKVDGYLLTVDHRNGVRSKHTIPEDWCFTRIMQYIEGIDSAV